MGSGTYIRKCRKEAGFKIKELASLIDIDPALLGKIERCDRIATKEQITRIIQKLQLDDQLMVLWLSDKIDPYVSEDTQVGLKALKVAEKRLKHGSD